MSIWCDRSAQRKWLTTKEDFTESGERYDLIFDCVANHSLSALRRVLDPRGSYIMVGAADGGGRWMIGILARLMKASVLSRLVGQRLAMVAAKITNADLTALGEHVNTGKVRPVIGRRYCLDEVPEAVRYVEHGHAQGKVIVTIEQNNNLKWRWTGPCSIARPNALKRNASRSPPASEKPIGAMRISNCAARAGCV